MAETTHTDWRRDQLSWTAESFHCLLFNSSALYYLQTPTRRYEHASTPLQFLPISGDWDVSLPPSLEWHVWSSSSGNNCHAVHRSLSSGASLCSGHGGTFTLSHIISRTHLRNFFRLLAIGMCHFRYLWNGMYDRHRAEITVMQFTGHSLPVHHFLTAQWEFFLPCQPSCILHSSPSYFSKCSLVNILSESLSSLPTPHKRSNCTTEVCKSRENNKSI